MHSASPNKRHNEVWNWFVSEESRTGINTAKHHGKLKVYCARCLDADKEVFRERDEQAGDDHTDEELYRECELVSSDSTSTSR